jgi:hypothetical protein
MIVSVVCAVCVPAADYCVTGRAFLMMWLASQALQRCSLTPRSTVF